MAIGAGAVAIATAAGIILHVDAAETRVRLRPKGVAYICEGGASVLCTAKGRLVQIAKKDSGEGSGGQPSVWKSWERKAALSTALAYSAVSRDHLDAPQVWLIPLDDVHALDTDLFFLRPPECREQRLACVEHKVHKGRAIALSVADLLKAPPGLPSEVGPVLTFEIAPGCGLQELEGLPSRDALLEAVNARTKSKASTSEDPQLLFSGDPASVATILRRHLNGMSGGCPRVYVDGEPAFPVPLPRSSWTVTKTRGGDLEASFAGCKPCDTSEMVDALVSVLSGLHSSSVLAELRDLQQFAGGENEKIASALLQLMQDKAGDEAVKAIVETQVSKDQVRRRRGKLRSEDHEHEGRRLMASTQWGPCEAERVQRWLSIFMLGRAAFDARVMVNFIQVPPAKADSCRTVLRSHRFCPLKDFAPAPSWADGVWVRATLLGLDEQPDPAVTIPAVSTELESAARTYRELGS